MGSGKGERMVTIPPGRRDSFTRRTSRGHDDQSDSAEPKARHLVGAGTAVRPAEGVMDVDDGLGHRYGI